MRIICLIINDFENEEIKYIKENDFDIYPIEEMKVNISAIAAKI